MYVSGKLFIYELKFQMKFSIITVVLNDRENISKTIQSVIGQDVELEYIVIDGESSDGTLDVIEQYRDKLSVFISEKDSGIAAAFNKGLNLVAGDVIGIVNSGDFLEEGALETVEKSFDDGSGIVYGDVQYWTKGRKEYKYAANHKLLNKFMSVNHPAVFVRSSIYERYGLFDENYPLAMDYELMLHFFTKGVTFKYVNQVLSNMALGGVSDSNWRDTYREAYIIRKKYLGYSPGLYSAYLFQLQKRYVSNFVSNSGLEIIKKIYRNKFSTIRKIR